MFNYKKANKIMKKIYQKPELFIEKITLSKTFLNPLSLDPNQKAQKNGEVLTKGRDYKNDYEEEPSYGDLW